MKNYLSKIISLLLIISVFAPSIIFAQTPPGFIGPQQPPGGTTNALGCRNTFSDLADILSFATCFLSKSIIPFIFTLAVVVFLWGVVQYVINPDNEDKREKGRDIMIWGVIGLFVMISIWGLVAVLGNTFGVRNAIPQLPEAH